MAGFFDSPYGASGDFNPRALFADFRQDILDQRAETRKAMASNPFPLGTPAQQAAADAALAGLPGTPGNPDPLLNDDTVNLQPDVNSGGSSFADGLEDTALSSIDLLAGVATRNVASGRMPFDPASPLVGKLQTPTTGMGGIGLLIIVLIVVALL